MQCLIDDLLAYSRVSHIDRARMRPVDLNHSVEWACGNLSAKIGESHAVIERQNLPTVCGDAVQLAQVFQNLIDNAIKYRGTASPLVRISAEKTGEGWTMAVQDNGIGISPEYRDRVFGLFKRLHGRSVPGTGIGLALVKRVIERHGGRIWVESDSGHGATFRFTLPDIVREGDNRTAETHPLPAKTFGSLRI